MLMQNDTFNNFTCFYFAYVAKLLVIEVYIKKDSTYSSKFIELLFIRIMY